MSIEYHSNIAESFLINYRSKPQFKERLNLVCDTVKKYVRPESYILDFGCGPGVIANTLAQLGYRVDGIDGSPDMIAIACRNKEEKTAFRVEHIPFALVEPIKEYDAIVSSSVLEYLTEIEVVFTLLGNLIKHNGLLIITIQNNSSLYRTLEKWAFFFLKKPAYLKHIHFKPTIEELSLHLKMMGFSLKEVKYFGKKSWFFRKLGFIFPETRRNTMVLCVFEKNL